MTELTIIGIYWVICYCGLMSWYSTSSLTGKPPMDWFSAVILLLMAGLIPLLILIAFVVQVFRKLR